MVLQVFSSVAIIVLVLIQRGKGADAGAGFGAGASGTVFGARGARTGLSRATAIFAAIFMLNSLALAYLGAAGARQEPTSILDQIESEQVPVAPQPTTP
jgi:preprotein translocase subunit SecG